MPGFSRPLDEGNSRKLETLAHSESQGLHLCESLVAVVPIAQHARRTMPCVVLTGGPGVGKTLLLAELGARGYATVEESARAIIAERVASGLSARPELPIFAREILRRDVEKFLSHAPGSEWIFFDRGVLDALGLLQEVDPLPIEDLQRLLSAYSFHTLVFILPPWEAIYANDAERDQTFVEAVNVYNKLQRWYRSCGYRVHDVPRLSVQQRADHVLQMLSQSDT